jgi:hypothetical protein
MFNHEPALPIDAINLNDTPIDDNEFAELTRYRRGLSGIRQIEISFTNVTDSSLRELDAFPSIEVLYIGNTKTTDDGLLLLERLPNLRIIGLSRQHITARGLEHLSHLRNLHVLKLDPLSSQMVDVVVKTLPNVAIVL